MRRDRRTPREARKPRSSLKAGRRGRQPRQPQRRRRSGLLGQGADTQASNCTMPSNGHEVTTQSGPPQRTGRRPQHEHKGQGRGAEWRGSRDSTPQAPYEPPICSGRGRTTRWRGSRAPARLQPRTRTEWHVGQDQRVAPPTGSAKATERTRFPRRRSPEPPGAAEGRGRRAGRGRTSIMRRDLGRETHRKD